MLENKCALLIPDKGYKLVPRDIDDVLAFRGDLSPFLVHLTKSDGGRSASEILRAIIETRELVAGPSEVSDAKFGGYNLHLSGEERRAFFSAVCFSETPLDETHCLLEVRGRAINLEPYGFVFMKSRLETLGVAPVLYLNNMAARMNPVAQSLFEIDRVNPAAARLLLPLVSVSGTKLVPPGHHVPPPGNVDWRWEREWRLPACLSPMRFATEDVFVGLCPHEEITILEQSFPGVGFVDPRRNMKWYATKLIAGRQRINLRHSVV